MSHDILVERLIDALGCSDPWGVEFDWKHVFSSRYDGSERQEYASEAWKDAYYHGARIQHLLYAKDATPIDVDCLVSGPHIMAVPVMVDGWHRLFAAHLRGSRTINANFGGRIDLLDWLVGATDTRPEY